MYAGLILAAGQARRFGSDKRQALLPHGQTMLDHVIGAYTEVLDEVWVVLPPSDAFGLSVCRDHGVITVECPQSHLGMGHSLAAGARSILTTHRMTEPEGLIIGLADMPGLSAKHLTCVLSALQRAITEQGEHALAVPVYQGQYGHPRGFAWGQLEKLTQLSGDQGARKLFDWSQAEHIELQDPSALQDIDYPEDLQAFANPIQR